MGLPDEIAVFDVGGTSLRSAIFRPATRELEGILRRPTPSCRTMPGAAASRIREALYEEMASMVRALLPGAGPSIVSVAFPGPIDPEGKVLSAPTVWGDDRTMPRVPVREQLGQLWPGARILVLNDMTATGHCFLENPGEDLCVVTVSSGIGHKVFIHGRPVTGPNGRGGELGHLRIDTAPDAPVCDCGARGHLAAFASGRATAYQLGLLAATDPGGFRSSRLGRSAGGDPRDVGNEAVVEAFRGGDPWARILIERMAKPLGQVLAAVHLAVGVERFVIVGGFALALGPAYVDRVRAEAAASGWDLGADWESMVRLGDAGEDSALLGAGLFALRCGGTWAARGAGDG